LEKRSNKTDKSLTGSDSKLETLLDTMLRRETGEEPNLVFK
jgi:hypothetical protein